MKPRSKVQFWKPKAESKRSSRWQRLNRHDSKRKVLAELRRLKQKVKHRPRRLKPQDLAEAAAILKKAEAWKQFNEAARLQTILEKLPAIIQASAVVFGAVAAPLGNIDKVVVIEQGNGNGQGGVSRFASNAPSVIFGLLQQLEALGLNVPSLLAQFGLKTEADQAAPVAKAEVTDTASESNGRE